MFLDTDVLVALCKERDWLRDAAEKRVNDAQGLCTSAAAVVEAQLVIQRDEGREDSMRVLAVLAERNIRILPLTEEVLVEAERLRANHPRLHLFDGLHLASARIAGAPLLTSDRFLLELGEGQVLALVP